MNKLFVLTLTAVLLMGPMALPASAAQTTPGPLGLVGVFADWTYRTWDKAVAAVGLASDRRDVTLGGTGAKDAPGPGSGSDGRQTDSCPGCTLDEGGFVEDPYG